MKGIRNVNTRRRGGEKTDDMWCKITPAERNQFQKLAGDLLCLPDRKIKVRTSTERASLNAQERVSSRRLTPNLSSNFNDYTADIFHAFCVQIKSSEIVLRPTMRVISKNANATPSTDAMSPSAPTHARPATGLFHLAFL
jgi:hypothetical protein